MHWLARFFQKTKSEQQLDAELRFHLEKQVADYISSGLSPEEARRRANLTFGALESVKEQSREIRRASFIDTIYQDVRYGLRVLRKNPGFTLAAALTLALGIGANTAIFSIVNAVILRPLPYKDSSRIVTVTTHTAMFPLFNLGLSWVSLERIRSQAPAVEQTAGYVAGEKTVTGNGEPTILNTASVTDGFFDELGATAQLGRLFAQDEFKSGQNHEVVLSDALWRTRFGADPAILSKTLVLDGESYRVVGIAAPKFSFPQSEQAWLPLALTSKEQQPTYFMLQTICKLRHGATLEALTAQFNAIASQQMKDSPLLGNGFRLSAKPLLSGWIHDSRDVFLMLLAASAFVLLIACANLASLLLARGSARQREMALRAALGASPTRLLRQGLVESCLLGLIGGVIGLALAAEGIQLFQVVAPPDTPRLNEISVDSTLLWFSLASSLVAGVLFGIVPARRAAKMDPNEALREGAGTNLGAARSTRQSRLGSALVTLEVALAFVLVVGSVLMTLTLSRLLHENTGFRTDHLLSFDLPQPRYNFAADPEGKAFIKTQAAHLQEVVAKIQEVPGVAEVTVSDHGVLSGLMMMQAGLVVDGAIPASTKETRTATTRYVYSGYFRMMGIPLLRGREFTDQDSAGEQARRVAVVNAAMAREYWGTLDVLGKRIGVTTEGKGDSQWYDVVGVVADAREVSLRDAPSPTYFLSILQGGTGSMHLLVRTQTDPDALGATISRQIWAAYPDQPITHLTTMAQNISQSLGNERLRSVLLTIFAGIGFALALVGVYGVISYSVARRIQEIGIRMALGAAPRDVLRMVIGQGLVPVALGVVIGAGAALGLTRLVANQLYGVKPADPATFIGATALVLIVAVLACCIPARRAMGVDPIVALRYE